MNLGNQQKEMFTFRIEGARELGPLEEKYATSGPINSPTIVFAVPN
jgi:hypothetical protein